MPIRREFRHFYRGTWPATRARILERAGNVCEQCGKPNRQDVWVFSSAAAGQFWCLPHRRRQRWIACLTGKPIALRLIVEPNDPRLRTIRVVLTVAHLNHTPGDDRDENLRSLCQWCHLTYDGRFHRQTRSERKDTTRPLLEGAA
jgi:hypothetical protein